LKERKNNEEKRGLPIFLQRSWRGRKNFLQVESGIIKAAAGKRSLNLQKGQPLQALLDLQRQQQAIHCQEKHGPFKTVALRGWTSSSF
jgi:hypothetical protein